MTVAAVITAAGSGSRLGAEVPKALVPIQGRALVVWATDTVRQVADAIVVTAPASHLDEFRAALPDVTVVAGGSTRQDSVARGLAALPEGSSIVLIHDAARAFQPASVMQTAIDAVRAGADGAVPVVPVVDTLVEVGADNPATASAPELGATVDREGLRAVQTPQVLTVEAALAAHSSGVTGATDDAQLAKAAGFTVVEVPGDERGFKVTRPLDVALAVHVAGLMEDA
ncbi:2-C-methyl-D-erythritol 4-phosphate cytidylyltransferase [Demequina sp. B12]|uniref:IspD/TarI family cytidylyltransferase n=1 Tax=Demequina sp. B12 TaxID=2992757 RepID=UPI00237AFD26|nr:IspD/TarI family cytidylyltransferase [Demequina sp. B12]MDE0573704.1 2-C-methyl-D-erythritol 4-phosphate cytidylyltransferase [Demequina sp. B12]